MKFIFLTIMNNLNLFKSSEKSTKMEKNLRNFRPKALLDYNFYHIKKMQ